MNIETGVFEKTPCDPAIIWMASQPDLHTAWEVCSHGGWMWWCLRNSKGNMPPKKISVAFAKACAKRAKGYAYYAAYAKSAAAEWAAAARDAAYYTAEFAAAAAAAAAAARDAAYYTAEFAADADAAAERQWQADWIRKHVENPF